MRRQPKIKLDKVLFRAGKLTVRPGDFLVLKTEHYLTKEQTMALRDIAEQQFKGLGVQIAIMTAGMSIAVLRKEIADGQDTNPRADSQAQEAEHP